MEPYNEISITYLGRPTVILEIGGLRLMTDPTLTSGPFINDPGNIDVVLLGHNQYGDNLDKNGRALLKNIKNTVIPLLWAPHCNGLLDTAAAFQGATNIPLHFEGWTHYTENREMIRKAFKALGIEQRLKMLVAGSEITL